MKASTEKLIADKKANLEAARKLDQSNKKNAPVEPPKKSEATTDSSTDNTGATAEDKLAKQKKEEARLNNLKIINEKTGDITNAALDKMISAKEIPRTPLNFEVEFNSFKDNYAKLWEYLQKFQASDLTTIYKSREIESKIFITFIKVFSTVYKTEISEKVTDYLSALSKTKNAKLMAKFLIKKEKAELRELVNKLDEVSPSNQVIKDLSSVLLATK